MEKAENKSKNYKFCDENRKKVIANNIKELKQQIENTRLNFDMETDEYLIDSLIYQMLSLNKRYQYFIKAAKQNGLSLNDIVE